MLRPRPRLLVWLLIAQLPLAIAAAAAEPRPDRPLSPDPMEDAYRRALRDWASGDGDRPAERGAELVIAAGAEPECSRWLQLHVALALGAPGGLRSPIRTRPAQALPTLPAPEALLPVLDFHLAVHGRLVTLAGTGTAPAPTDLLPVARSILELYLEAPLEPAAVERAVSGALAAAAVARRVSLEGSLTELRDHLAWTLELAPRNAAALAGLAEVEEALGRYGQAAGRFAELTAQDPDDLWARFGLAFNLLRSGAEREGVAALSELAGDPAAGWVRPLAIQELARHAEAGGRREEALVLLREGVDRFSDEPQLAILLASYLEPDRPAAETALERAFAAPPRPSPRLLYDLGPDERFGVAVRDFAEHATGRASLLLDWLDRIDDLQRSSSGLPCRRVEPPP